LVILDLDIRFFFLEHLEFDTEYFFIHILVIEYNNEV
jgi:hypothetical protein